MPTRTTWQETDGGYVPVTETYDEPVDEPAAPETDSAPPAPTRQSTVRDLQARRRVSTAATSTSTTAQGGFQGNRVSSATARKMVLVSIAVLFVLNIYHEEKGTSKVGFYQRLWGTGVVGIFLAILADFAPGIAGPFAAVIVLSQIPGKGNAALTGLLAKASPGSKTGTTANTQTPTRPGGESPGGPATGGGAP